MDDEMILARGGTEDDIRSYAEQNGADSIMPKTHKERIEEMVDALCAEVYEDWNLDVIPECREEWRAPIRTTLTRFAEVVREEVISYIGQKEGWEESEDVYREHFGLPTKYKK